MSTRETHTEARGIPETLRAGLLRRRWKTPPPRSRSQCGEHVYPGRNPGRKKAVPVTHIAARKLGSPFPENKFLMKRPLLMSTGMRRGAAPLPAAGAFTSSAYGL